jgi:lipoate-protein ligase B
MSEDGRVRVTMHGTGALVPNHELSPRTYLIMCGSVRRAVDLMAELDTTITPEDWDRVRHGVSHELETLARALELPNVRGRHADKVILDDPALAPDKAVPLPFDD